MHKHFFSLFFLLFLVQGCTVHAPAPQTSNIHRLAQLLQSQNRHIPTSESLKLSKDIFYKTRSLSKAFKLTSPPQYHNFLVTIGLRKKGLCYDWSDALYVYLTQREYPSFTFHLMGANIGKYWTEHNSLVVVAKGLSIEEGIIVDPWRDSARLYFSKVKEDVKYSWKHRATRGCRSTVRLLER
jgi:hypothetical protein